jgi:hypothetical protein
MDEGRKRALWICAAILAQAAPFSSRRREERSLASRGDSRRNQQGRANHAADRCALAGR